MQIRDYIDSLPDAWKKEESSNNYKLLLIEQSLVQALRDDVEDVDATLDIYTATGKTLDLYGSIYGQARGVLTDEQYRYIILQKSARNRVGGDYNSVVESLAVVFGVPTSSFTLNETENTCEVEVVDIPYSVMQSAGITSGQIYQIVKAMVPVGVRIAPIELQGTFEFGSAYEQGRESGFGSIDQTVGGYFGELATSDIDIPV
jgi:hypothetical protein